MSPVMAAGAQHEPDSRALSPLAPSSGAPWLALRPGPLLARHPTLIAGGITLVLILIAGVLAPLWWTGDPLEMKPAVRLRPPSAERWFGSDNFGRDIYTRTLYGSRISVTVGAAGSTLRLGLGTTPGLVAPLIVQGTYIAASAILFEAYLSFLGAGTPPHIPSWGNIMAEGRAYVQLAFWIILFPGIFLAATVLAINLVGDGLRDLLNVR